ncbi:unnamed protein product, partial [Bubo scandiacus]
MGPRWAWGLLVLLLLLALMLEGSPQDPELVLVAPRLVALGSPVGLLVAAVGPVTGTVTAWPGEGGRGAGPCAPPVPFDLGTHNDFNQIVNIEVTPEQARRCGVLEAAVGQTLLLEAQSPPPAPPGGACGAGGAPGGAPDPDRQTPLRPRADRAFPRLLPGPRPAAEPRTHPGHHHEPPGGPRAGGAAGAPGAGAERPDGAAGHRPPRAVAGPGAVGRQPRTSGAAEFSLRPYALPGFSLRSVPDRRFLLLGPGPAPPLRLRLHVRYPDGAGVGGWAQLRVGLRGGPFLPGLEQRTRVTAGQAQFNVTLEAVGRALGVAPRELQGEGLRLLVTVVNSDGGEAVRQEVGVGLVTSPWALDLSPSPRFFVPGAPFTLLGRVLEAGGAPAPGVEVRVGVGVTGAAPPPALSLRAGPSGAIEVPINVPSGASGLELSVSAGAPGSPPAQARLSLRPVAAVAGGFLALGGPGGPLSPGELLRLRLHHVGAPPAPPRVHVLAVARGRLVAAQGVQLGTVTEVTLPVTPAMTPRLRLVAFAPAGGRLVAASWGVPVVGTCHRQVRGTGSTGRDWGGWEGMGALGELGGTGVGVLGGLEALGGAGGTGSTGQTGPTGQVRVGAGQRGHPLRPQTPLSLTVEAVLGSSDLGCGPGGGPDAEGMFRAAGLVLGGPDPPLGPPPGCPPAPPRPRRSLTLLEELGEAAGAPARRRCRDGRTLLPLRVSCPRRARRVPRAGGCRGAFLRCCRRARGGPGGGPGGGPSVPAGAGGGAVGGGAGPGPAASSPRAGSGAASPRAAPPGSPCSSPTPSPPGRSRPSLVIPGHGLCVALPQRVTVTQDLYVRLQLPPSTRPHEQLQLLPHIHSRLPHGVNVTVTLAVAQGSVRGWTGPPAPGGAPRGAVALPLTLVALRPGDVPVTVTARGPWGVGDSVTRVLHVEPEGEPHLEETSYVLDTDDKGGRTLQIPGDPPAGIVPDGEFSVSIRVTGFERVQNFRKADGSYSAWQHRGGSTWLTALVLRVLALARPYLPVAPGGPGVSLRWLLEQQRPDGTFRESDPVLHREMQGSVADPGPEATVSLTAFVVVALQGTRVLLPPDSPDHAHLDQALSQAATFLRGRVGTLGTFGTAITTYALALVDTSPPGPSPALERLRSLARPAQGGRAWFWPAGGLRPRWRRRPTGSWRCCSTATASGPRARLGGCGSRATTGGVPLHPGTPTARGGGIWGGGGPPGWRGSLRVGGPGCWGPKSLGAPGREDPDVWVLLGGVWGGGGVPDTGGALGWGSPGGVLDPWVSPPLPVSPQDTLVALEALAQMWLQWGDAAGSGLSLTLSWPGGPGGPRGTRVTLGPGLKSLEQELQVPLGSPIKVQVEGHGEGTLTVLRQFRLMTPSTAPAKGWAWRWPSPDQSSTRRRTTRMTRRRGRGLRKRRSQRKGRGLIGRGLRKGRGLRRGGAYGGCRPPSPTELWEARGRRRRDVRDPGREVAFLVCVWREAGVELSGMAVAEITLLSGFRPHRSDLDKLRDVVDRWISHYELSGTRLVIYLDQVPTERQCISFGATQEVAVGQLQPAMAAIYDYYEPGACPRLRRPPLALDDRLDFACYSPRVDYALVVRVLAQSEVGPFLAFEIEILEVLLGGSPGGRGQALGRGSCPLRLRPPAVPADGGDGTLTDAQGRPQFLLGPNSWVEEVPPSPAAAPPTPVAPCGTSWTRCAPTAAPS